MMQPEGGPTRRDTLARKPIAGCGKRARSYAKNVGRLPGESDEDVTSNDYYTEGRRERNIRI